MKTHHPVLFLDLDGVILSGEELWASRMREAADPYSGRVTAPLK
jgi:beta-phosphoglucomutase-like phosphatase (HAD superfamily)